MSSFEANYEADFLARLTKDERRQLRDLHRKFDEKFDRIIALLVEQLGISVADAEEEAQHATECWDEDVEMPNKTVEPATPLQCLLREHHWVGVDIMNLRDEVFAREYPVSAMRRSK
jgi:hypothetical protein